MSRCAFLVACLLVLAPSTGPARAVEPSIKEHLAAARAFQEKKDLREALVRVGNAILLAHRNVDLLGEGEAIPVLDDIAKAFPDKPEAGGKVGPPTRREAMALLMARLAPGRSGAFVSANALARKLALLGIENGDGLYGDEAYQVIRVWYKAKDVGDIADFYIEWLLRVRVMDQVGSIGTRGGLDGFPALRRKIVSAMANGWADECTHAATDLARFQIKWKQDVGGLAVLTQAETACREAEDAAVLERWQKAMDRHLGAAIPALLQPIKRLSGKFEPIPAGTAGVDRPAGATGLGAAYEGLKHSSILVKVSRNDKEV